MSATLKPPTPFAQAALALDADFNELKPLGDETVTLAVDSNEGMDPERKRLGRCLAMKKLTASALVLSTLLLSTQASAMRWPSRRDFCIAGLLGGSAALLFWGNIDSLLTGIPRDPIRPEQLTDNGFSADPLVNLRQKVANIHGVAVTAVIEGPDAVTQYEFGKFLSDFLKSGGMPDQFPMMTSLMPPRTVTVQNGMSVIRYEATTVRASWNLGSQLVREQQRMARDVPVLAQRIFQRTGILFGHGSWNRLDGGRLWSRWTVPYNEFEGFLKRFEELSAGITMEAFPAANLGAESALIIDVAAADRENLWVPYRHIDPANLKAVLDGVRAGTFRLPALDRPRAGGPIV